MEILCETSIRHVHLAPAHVRALFGEGAVLTPQRPLSQPGQFLATQRVTLAGPKREIENVAIIGPERTDSQVEIALSDSFVLGIKDVPLRLSGDIAGTPGIILRSETAEVELWEGVIVAKRHVHLDPATAKKNGFNHGDIATLKFGGDRPGTLGGVAVRVTPASFPAVHLDSDEANAVFATSRVTVTK